MQYFLIRNIPSIWQFNYMFAARLVRITFVNIIILAKNVEMGYIDTRIQR